MTNQNQPSSLIIPLNVEELVDAAWSADHSLLPAISSKGNTILPDVGGLEVYREVYDGFLQRFTATAVRLATVMKPGLEVKIDAGYDLLRSRLVAPFNPTDDPFFDEVVAQTQLPTIEDIVAAGDPE